MSDFGEQNQEATQAWVEYEYNRKIHLSERLSFAINAHLLIGEAPITRFLAGPEVMRPCPCSDALRLAFTRSERRMQRKSDGVLILLVKIRQAF